MSQLTQLSLLVRFLLQPMKFRRTKYKGRYLWWSSDFSFNLKISRDFPENTIDSILTKTIEIDNYLISHKRTQLPKFSRWWDNFKMKDFLEKSLKRFYLNAFQIAWFAPSRLMFLFTHVFTGSYCMEVSEGHFQYLIRYLLLWVRQGKARGYRFIINYILINKKQVRVYRLSHNNSDHFQHYFNYRHVR